MVFTWGVGGQPCNPPNRVLSPEMMAGIDDKIIFVLDAFGTMSISTYRYRYVQRILQDRWGIKILKRYLCNYVDIDISISIYADQLGKNDKIGAC